MLSVRKSLLVRIILGGAALVLAVLGLWHYAPSLAAETTSVYLPLVMRDFPSPPTVFGGHVSTFTDPALIQLAEEARVSWVRLSAFDWSKIEPNPPVNGMHTYDWSSVPEDSLRNIAASHMYAIAVVLNTPSWAQKYAGATCGPPAQDKLSDYAAFLQAAVQKYGASPYNVRYWELGNEPDVDPSLVPPDLGFGCWGDDDDPYYGGGYYADMLKVVYPAIKAVDPSAQVLNGGLLLDCDPADQDCDHATGKDIPPRFFEGILRNGGGDFLDAVNFHGYAYIWKGEIVDEEHPSWDQRGGVVLGKAAFLQEVMQQYGVDKPLLDTEGALLCPEWNHTDCDPPTAAYEDAKADYVVWLYTRTLADNFMGTVWYTLSGGGWRNAGLIGDTGNPTSAYYAFKFIAAELAGAEYTGQPSGLDSALRGYIFRKPDGTSVWVVWAVDNAAHTLTLPEGYTQVYDKVGASLSVSTDTLDVKSPVYIEVP